VTAVTVAPTVPVPVVSAVSLLLVAAADHIDTVGKTAHNYCIHLQAHALFTVLISTIASAKVC
jgi:hypothetical protein